MFGDTFKDPSVAKIEAIKQGRLSRCTHDYNYAPHWLYVGTRKGLDQFKHWKHRVALTTKGWDMKPEIHWYSWDCAA